MSDLSQEKDVAIPGGQFCQGLAKAIPQLTILDTGIRIAKTGYKSRGCNGILEDGDAALFDPPLSEVIERRIVGNARQPGYKFASSSKL